MFRFYHAPLSPFCRKVRLVLSEKKIDFELIEEKLDALVVVLSKIRSFEVVKSTNGVAT